MYNLYLKEVWGEQRKYNKLRTCYEYIQRNIKKVNRALYTSDILENYDWIYTEYNYDYFMELKAEADKNKLPPSYRLDRGYVLGNHGNIILKYDNLEKVNDKIDILPTSGQYILIRNNKTTETVGLLLMGGLDGKNNHKDLFSEEFSLASREIGYRFQDPIELKKEEMRKQRKENMEMYFIVVILSICWFIVYIMLLKVKEML